jgi:hypothetical protein
VALAKLCDRKNALAAPDMLNDRALPFFEEHEGPSCGPLRIKYYNEDRVHSGKYWFGKTPMQTFLGPMLLFKTKPISERSQK